VRSFERIHRANLVMMGVLPLQFTGNDSVASLGIKGDETVDILGVEKGVQPRQEFTAVIRRKDGSTKEIKLLLRPDTPIDVAYHQHRGISPSFLGDLLGPPKASARAA